MKIGSPEWTPKITKALNAEEREVLKGKLTSLVARQLKTWADGNRIQIPGLFVTMPITKTAGYKHRQQTLNNKDPKSIGHEVGRDHPGLSRLGSGD
jgi:hypothetical protein